MKVLALTASIELPDDARRQGIALSDWHTMIDNFFNGYRVEYTTEIKKIRPNARKSR